MPPEWKGHKQVDRILVYHNANRAGPHVEAYLVVDEQAYNIGVKRLTPAMMKDVRLNSQGKLTALSKSHLVDIWRKEIEKGSWLAQSTDHLPEEAREQWWNHAHRTGYGSGEMREVLLDDPVDLYKTGAPGSWALEFRDWAVSPDNDIYVFKIMPEGDKRNVNILSLGLKKPRIPELEDRLHLKADIGAEQFDKFRRNVGEDGIVTVKEDGASFYFEITKKGTTFWSPRTSKRTGQRIEYTSKVRDLRHITEEETIKGMGELLFVDRQTGKSLPAHKIGGILNSKMPVPMTVVPRLIIYRVDKVGRISLLNESYEDNLAKINELVKRLDNPYVEAPKEVQWNRALKTALVSEGLVGVSRGSPIIEGRKFKPRTETQDGVITAVQFHPGDSGGIAGVVLYTDDKTSQLYKTSSGFTRELKQDMMKHPTRYVGRVMKLSHYQGHGGRAAKFEGWTDTEKNSTFIAWHLDKGTY